MKKNIILALAFAIAAPCSFAQDEAPAPADAPQRNHEGQQHQGRQGRGQNGQRGQRPDMNPEQMGMFIIGNQLVLEQFDADKDGKLNDEEKAAVKAEVDKRRAARRDEMLKKFDKDGDGKISEEERKAMREEWNKNNPEIANKMKERHAEMLKKFDKDGDGQLNDDEKKAMREDRQKNRPGAGKDGPRGGEGRPGAGREGGPDGGFRRDPVMVLGHDLIMEKYDTDKNGELSDSEKEVLKADVKKLMDAKRAERRAQRGERGGDRAERGGPRRGNRGGQAKHGGGENTPPSAPEQE